MNQIEVKDVLSNNNKPITNELKSKIVYGNVNILDTYYFRGDKSNLTIFNIDEKDMHKTGGIYFTKNINYAHNYAKAMKSDSSIYICKLNLDK